MISSWLARNAAIAEIGAAIVRAVANEQAVEKMRGAPLTLRRGAQPGAMRG